jgi:hypothetical protein
VQVVVSLLESAENVLDSCTSKKVLLLQSESFAFFRCVVGIENGGNGFCSLSLFDGLPVVSIVEGRQVEFIGGL